VNFADLTPAGTVHVWAAPVKQNVTVVTPPEVLVAHGAAATDSGDTTPTDAKTSTANGKAIATDRILCIPLSPSIAV